MQFSSTPSSSQIFSPQDGLKDHYPDNHPLLKQILLPSTGIDTIVRSSKAVTIIIGIPPYPIDCSFIYFTVAIVVNRSQISDSCGFIRLSWSLQSPLHPLKPSPSSSRAYFPSNSAQDSSRKKSTYIINKSPFDRELLFIFALIYTCCQLPFYFNRMTSGQPLMINNDGYIIVVDASFSMVLGLTADFRIHISQHDLVLR